MAKFKNISQTFLYRKLVKYFGNMSRNYRDDCRDDDFFDVVRNCFEHDKAVELIEAAYSPSELDAMTNSRSRSCRLDLSDPLDSVFCALWNNESLRGKCRAILDSVCRYMLADGKDNGHDTAESRLGELKVALKLDDLEAEILTFAYVRDQTCFCWPTRIEDREKPLYYAMALDRSYGEVQKALSPQGKLLKLGLLDDDYDFSRRVLGGFMDGTSDETIQRRFYSKSDAKDPLPWSYFGDLAEKDGEVLKQMIAASGGKCNILLYGAPGTGKTSFARSHREGRAQLPRRRVRSVRRGQAAHERTPVRASRNGQDRVREVPRQGARPQGSGREGLGHPRDVRGPDRAQHRGRVPPRRGGAQGKASDIEITAREILRLKEMLNGILAEASGRSLESVTNDTDRDHFMSADEAKAWGIVDKVL